MKIKKREILILLICVVVWAIVQFIYVEFTGTLGDQDLYILKTDRELPLLSNTYIIIRIYKFLSYFLPGKLVALIPFLFTSIFLYRSLGSFYYYLTRNEKIIVLLTFFMPHFWIWQAVASKEAIIIPCGLVFSFYFSKFIFFDITLKEKLYAFLSLLFIGFLKTVLLPAYILLFLSLFIEQIISTFKEFKNYLKASFNYYSFFLFGIFSSILAIVLNLFKSQLIENIEKVMLLGSLNLWQNMDANTSRYDFYWSNYVDFFENMSWGIPASFLGILPSELANSAPNILLFLEGIYVLIIIFLVQIKLLGLSLKISNIRFVYFFGIIPSIIYIVLMQYSGGIFNAGTAIRYKQNIMPLMVYLPIYIIGIYRIKLPFKQTK